jgi:hypothetical protein
MISASQEIAWPFLLPRLLAALNPGKTVTQIYSKSRQQAEIAFGNAQSQFFGNSAADELASIVRSREEKTLRLREARLERNLPTVRRRPSPSSPNAPGRPNSSQHNRQDKDLKNARDNELSDRRTAAAEEGRSLECFARQRLRPNQPDWRGRRNAWRHCRSQGREVGLERERVKLEECERRMAEATERGAAARKAERNRCCANRPSP